LKIKQINKFVLSNFLSRYQIFGIASFTFLSPDNWVLYQANEI